MRGDAEHAVRDFMASGLRAQQAVDRLARPERITFEVAGIPRGQGRPRAALFGRRGAPQGVRVFEAPVDRDWKQIVMGQAVMHRPPAPLEGPLAVELTFRMPMPKAMPKRVRVAIAEGGTVHHAKRPDVDQCAKPVLDVLMHAGFFADDAQVAALAVRKVYASRPGVEVVVEALGAGACA